MSFKQKNWAHKRQNSHWHPRQQSLSTVQARAKAHDRQSYPAGPAKQADWKAEEWDAHWLFGGWSKTQASAIGKGENEQQRHQGQNTLKLVESKQNTCSCFNIKHLECEPCPAGNKSCSKCDKVRTLWGCMQNQNTKEVVVVEQAETVDVETFFPRSCDRARNCSSRAAWQT